ncbi:MAG: TolC family protein [Myxococcales bacterium]
MSTPPRTQGAVYFSIVRRSSLVLGLGLGLASAVVPACYHPEPLNPRAMMNELRQADAAGGAPPVGPPGSPAPPHLPEGTALGEDRSVALALLWNRDLRAFRLTRGIAAGEVVSAGALANPELRMELTHLQRRDLSQLGWDVRLSWEPPRPGVRAGRIGAASARLDEVESQVREREWDLTCDVRNAHATLVAIDDEIRVAQDTIANRQRLADAVSRRVAKGGTTRFDLDLVRLSLASAEHAESQRRLEGTLAASALAHLVGVGAPGGAVTVSGRLDEMAGDAVFPGQVELEDRALGNRATVAAAEARHRASEETLRAEIAARWPWFRLAAAPRVRRNEIFGATTDLVLGLDVMLPILDTNRGRVLSAEAARDEARADLATTLSGLRVDIARALAAVEAQRSILRHLEAQVGPLLVEHDRVLTLAAQALELDLPALISSENLVLASRIELIVARLELRKAWIALERAVGSRVTPASPSTSRLAIPPPLEPESGK